LGDAASSADVMVCGFRSRLNVLGGCTLRFLVVGAGFGQVHLEWLSECEGATVDVLCYQTNEARARQAADRFGIPAVSSDPAGVIAAGDVDAMVVVSPPRTHEALVRLGLDAGIHVVTDKPLAGDLPAARRLVARAAQAPGRAVVTFQWRLNPAFDRLRETVERGELGTVIRADLEFHHDFLAGPSTAWPWRHRRDEAGAGALGDQGVHLFDLLRWVVPGQWSVCGGTASVVWPQRSHESGAVSCETEDVAEVLLADSGAATGRVLVSRVSIGDRSLRMRVLGTAGSAVVTASADDASAVLTVFSAARNSPERIEFGPNAMNPYKVMVAEVDRRDPFSRLADFSDGCAAQIFLDEAISKGCGKPSFFGGQSS
jgi:predicted dehydrogenase